MYNPLRPHIVEFTNGKFAIRKFVLPLGWQYYDNQALGKDTHWWSQPKHSEWFLMPTLDKAQCLLATLNNPPLQVKKVYYEG